jgi:cytochrome c oxidase subunit 2
MTAPWRRLGLLLFVGTVGLGFLGSSGAEERPVVHVTAKRFSYDPSEIRLKKGVPVTLEFTSLDRDHGFKVPQLGIRADIVAGQTTRVDLVPDKAGKFDFLCDNFCGSGHEEMDGEIVVTE